MIRVVLASVVEGIIKRFTGTGRGGEVIEDREAMEHYGFTSRPLPGAEAVVIRDGNHFIMVASDDRRYRVALEAGELALYDDQGQKVHFKRNGKLHVVCTNELTADVANDVIVNTTRAAVNASESCIVTSPLVKAVASTQVILDTPLTTCTGNLVVDGGISCVGTYGDSGGKIVTPGDIESTGGEVKDQVRAMSADRAIYNGHTHPGDSGGTTGAPNEAL
jgi:phage gp45-like